MTDHYHLVRMPGSDKDEQFPCNGPDSPENPCRFSQGTPEELGVWVTTKFESGGLPPFPDWLTLYRMPPAVPADKSGIEVDQSVSDAIRESTENPKRTQTVPVTIEKTDGSKWVVGEAQVEVKDGDIHASMKLNPDSIAAHMSIPIPINSDFGPFSISTKGEPPSPADTLRAEGVIPSEPRFKRLCLDPECGYIETHHHGAACTRGCHCNRNGRSD